MADVRVALTIREAVAIALEALPGDLTEFVVLAKQRDTMRRHCLAWCHDYARKRGVILTDKDITSELDAIVSELRAGRPLSEARRPNVRPTR